MGEYYWEPFFLGRVVFLEGRVFGRYRFHQIFDFSLGEGFSRGFNLLRGFFLFLPEVSTFVGDVLGK